MKHFFFYSFRVIILVLNVMCFGLLAQSAQPFQISENELRSLNLNEAEAQEFQQFISALNNLPPEEQEFLAQLGQEMEKQMKDKGLDPSNPDDIFKWVEQQQATPQVKAETKPLPEKQPLESVKAPRIPTIRTDVTLNDARLLLKDILTLLSSARQKAITRETMSRSLDRWQQDLNELLYYLNILTKESLLKHLISKDFATLYKNLDILREALLAFEPLIAAREPISSDEEDPYDILGISYQATPAQIDSAFENLKNTRSPEAVAKQLDAEGITGKERQNIIKESRLSFSFIQDAYDSLKDPKQRALINRLLKDRIDQDKQNEQTSQAAFRRVIEAISTALYDHKILSDIQQLLKKHEPEELALAKIQTELEQKALERSKQPVKIAQPVRPVQSTGEKQYDAFYQQLQQEKQARDIASYFRPSYSDSFKSAPGVPFPTASEAPKADAAKKQDATKGEDKKKDSKEAKEPKEDKDDKGKKDGGRPAGPPAKPAGKKISEQEQEDIIDLMKDVEGLLKRSKDTLEYTPQEATPSKRSAEIDLDALEGEEPEEPKKQEVALPIILQELDVYLQKPVSRTPVSPDPVKLFKEFSKQNKWAELKEALGQLKGKLKSKIDNPGIQARWKDKIFDKYGYRIEKSWAEPVLALLAPTQYVGMKDPDKLRIHFPQEGQDAKKQSKKPNPLDLGVERDTIRSIAQAFRDISQALGIDRTQQPKKK